MNLSLTDQTNSTPFQNTEIVDLVDFLVGTHKNICEHVTHFPGTFCLVTYRKYMNKTRHVTYELPCTRDKRNQITRQKSVFVPVVSEVR